MLKRYFFFFVIICIQALNMSMIFAGTSDRSEDGITKDMFIYGSYHRGVLFPHHGSMSYYNEDYINGFELRVGRSFPEIRVARIPDIGVGVYHSNLSNDKVYGNTTSLYAFFSSGFFEDSKLFNFGTTFAGGINYVDNPFHKDDNPFNQSIGSHYNAFIILSLDFKYRITNKLSLYLNPSLVHMSNGRIKLPNTGLNLYNIQFGTKYIINNKEFDISKYSLPKPFEKSKKHRISALSVAGVRQMSTMRYETEFISSILLEYTYSLSPNIRIGAGGDLFFVSDFMIDYIPDDIDYEYNQLKGGLHFSCEIIWDKLSFILHPGLRIYNKEPNEKLFFSRVGIRYNFFSDFFLNCSLKSSSFVAEYIEWGIGYNFNF